MNKTPEVEMLEAFSALEMTCLLFLSKCQPGGTFGLARVGDCLHFGLCSTATPLTRLLENGAVCLAYLDKIKVQPKVELDCFLGPSILHLVDIEEMAHLVTVGAGPVPCPAGAFMVAQAPQTDFLLVCIVRAGLSSMGGDGGGPYPIQGLSPPMRTCPPPIPKILSPPPR